MWKWECGRRKRAESSKLKAESRVQKTEFGMWKGEGGRWNIKEMGRSEGGSGTRRRPIGRDYAAAKDAEGGMKRGLGD
jgi:hypothetical protein